MRMSIGRWLIKIWILDIRYANYCTKFQYLNNICVPFDFNLFHIFSQSLTRVSNVSLMVPLPNIRIQKIIYSISAIWYLIYCFIWEHFKDSHKINSRIIEISIFKQILCLILSIPSSIFFRYVTIRYIIIKIFKKI